MQGTVSIQDSNRAGLRGLDTHNNVPAVEVNLVALANEGNLALEGALYGGSIGRLGVVILYHNLYFYKYCILSLLPVAYRVVAGSVVQASGGRIEVDIDLSYEYRDTIPRKASREVVRDILR